MQPDEALSEPVLFPIHELATTEDPVGEARAWKVAEQILLNSRFTPIIVHFEGGEHLIRDGHHRLEAVQMLRQLGLIVASHVPIQKVTKRRS